MFQRIAIHGCTIGLLAAVGCGDTPRADGPSKAGAAVQALVAAGAGAADPVAAPASQPMAAAPEPAVSNAERAARAEIASEDSSGLPPERRRAYLEADKAARREALQIKRALLSQAESTRRGRAASEERDALDRKIQNMRDNIGRAEEKLRALEAAP